MHNIYECIVPETTYDYSRNQTSWTLLYKEKVRISENKAVVLYNRLKQKT